MNDDKLSDKLHHLGEHTKDALKDAAEKIGEAPGKLGEHTLAAAKAGEDFIERLAHKAHDHEDHTEH